MSTDEPIATAINDAPDKVHEIIINCDPLWSHAQEFAYLRLADKTDDNQYTFIRLYAARAKRIAATYARFYLETEDFGDPDKLGRYYWAALAAFASKTVGCILDSPQIQSSYAAGTASLGATDMKAIANGLARGNLWLFNDIAPAHWFYNRYPEHFFSGMACLDRRDANQLDGRVKDIINDLPWATRSLATVNHFKPSSDLITGFTHMLKIEVTSDSTKRAGFQLEHLLAVAEHEQGAVLQPLIYDDPVFEKWLIRERDIAQASRSRFLFWVSPALSLFLSWASPTYQLVFTHACSESDPELKSVAPNDMKIEDFKSRMDWINDAANMFHKLMGIKETHMLNELRTIAGWVNSPDARFVY